ncbi:Ig-like domain-containing protein [uncultured Aquimarina sp.]|uniref:Ig-like domain-containing protein n=1 Tax=uncultured Aquimarina sp. TaxID=575652 RepID=UPI00260D0ECF|nr:Ig-like domain-containing protein [uncultured Aquimarina sp.]
MKTTNFIILLGLLLLLPVANRAQNVEVDVNVDIKHSVNGVSDFGRDRHIVAHSNLYEGDWDGEADKLKYFVDDLDVYFGRDNGLASFLFAYSPADPERPNKHDPDSLTVMLDFWKGWHDDRLITENRVQFKDKIQSMVMGTNPHPTYPTLSYFPNGIAGSQWGRENNATWITQDIETSADWIVQYMDEFFSTGAGDPGQPMPEYWEVMNEPDFKLNTGQFMMSSWEDIWEYHNLVALGVKQKLGNRAPKIGGMTWGSHDLFNNDQFSRFQTVDYVDNFYGNTPADEIAKAYARSQVESPYLGQNFPWFQWEVIWKGFIDVAGANMDYYSVHLYDWPTYDGPGGVTRSGSHVEATLDMLETYDVNKFGARKPIIISEYGGVKGAWDFKAHDKRYDWEIMKPFSAMMMQFLERPDYIQLSMPFTPTKAQWGDTDTNGDGVPEYFYQYKMMRDDDQDGNWEWSDYIKWFELWSEVKGTRVDTKSSDPDIQVDCYIDGNDAYLILNNLEQVTKGINLNFFGNTPGLQNVSSKHLYLSGVRDIKLDNTDLGGSAPSSVQLAGDGTMILKYTYANDVNINQSSIEKKFYGPDLSTNQRVTIQNGDNTFFVNGVNVPPNPDQAEAMLRVTANLFNDDDDKPGGFLTIDKLLINGTEVETPIDWRGGSQLRSRWFGTLEIPIPASLIQTNNTITIDFKHVGEVSYVNLSTWEFSKKPGRSDEGPSDPDPIAVTGISISPTSVTLDPGQTSALAATIIPANSTNKTITWSSSNNSITTVNANGLVSAINPGVATITATTQDGGFTTSSSLTVNPPSSGATLIIEAEDFTNTGGTFDDAFVGGPGLGVNRRATNINYVNNEDWADYNLDVAVAGTYVIDYLISTPSDGAQIQLLVDGAVATTSNIPNNGAWESYTSYVDGTVNLSAGSHTIRIQASSSATWQWNLDKITLTTGVAVRSSTNTTIDKEFEQNIYLFPNPTTGKIIIQGLDQEKEHLIRIYDIKGAKYLDQLLNTDHMIDVESLKRGVYFLTIINPKQGNRTLKLIKK